MATIPPDRSSEPNPSPSSNLNPNPAFREEMSRRYCGEMDIASWVRCRTTETGSSPPASTPCGRMARFVVDPDEGEILRSWPVGPAFGHGGPDEGFAVPGPYGPVEEGDLGSYGPPEGHVHARRDEGGAPDRYERGPLTARHADETPMASRHAKLAMHSVGNPARRAVQHPSPSQATKVRPLTAAAPASTPARPAPPPPGQARAVTGPPAKTSMSPAPIQTIASASFFRAQLRAGERAESSSPMSPAEQPPPLEIENEAVPKSNIGK